MSVTILILHCFHETHRHAQDSMRVKLQQCQQCDLVVCLLCRLRRIATNVMSGWGGWATPT